jgi:alpha-L-fucosidase
MNASPRYTRSGDISWFSNDAFGLFIHLGINSSAAIEPSWPMKAFLAEDAENDSSEKWSPERYYGLAPKFTAAAYDPQQWAAVAKEAGCRYAVLGTKHHDGFCLWPTKTKDLHSGNHGPKRDLVGPFVEATRKAGLKVGLYLSLIDWEDPDFVSMPASVRFSSPVRPVEFDPARWQRFLQRVFKQVEELLTNYGKIDLLWFDVPGWGGDLWHADEMKMMMLGLQPHIICNDRLPGAGDFVTPEQQIPVSPIAGPWETCMTTNETWGYHPDPARYKSARSLVRALCEIRSLGGNLLLNVGPDCEARFPDMACQRLREVGEWLRKSGEAIYGASRGLDYRHFWGPSTRKGNTLYCHLPAIPNPDFELRGIADDPCRVYLLQSGEDLPFRRLANRIVIDCADKTLDPFCPTVAVEFAAPPASLQFSSTVFTSRGERLWEDRL